MDTPNTPRSQLYAPPSLRARAYLFDVCSLGLLVMLFLALAEAIAIPAGAGRMLVWLGLALLVFYEPVLVHFCGGTIGHQRFHLRVVGSNGRNLPFWQAVMRTAIKWVTLVYAVPLMLGTGRRQALWDLPFGSTVQVREPESRGVASHSGAGLRRQPTRITTLPKCAPLARYSYAARASSKSNARSTTGRTLVTDRA